MTNTSNATGIIDNRDLRMLDRESRKAIDEMKKKYKEDPASVDKELEEYKRKHSKSMTAKANFVTAKQFGMIKEKEER